MKDQAKLDFNINKGENELSLKNSEDPVVSVETELKDLNLRIRRRKTGQFADKVNSEQITALQLDQIQPQTFEQERVSTDQITAKLLSSSSRDIPQFKFRPDDNQNVQISTASSIPKNSIVKLTVKQSLFDSLNKVNRNQKASKIQKCWRRYRYSSKRFSKKMRERCKAAKWVADFYVRLDSEQPGGYLKEIPCKLMVYMDKQSYLIDILRLEPFCRYYIEVDNKFNFLANPQNILIRLSGRPEYVPQRDSLLTESVPRYKLSRNSSNRDQSKLNSDTLDKSQKASRTNLVSRVFHSSKKSNILEEDDLKSLLITANFNLKFQKPTILRSSEVSKSQIQNKANASSVVQNKDNKTEVKGVESDARTFRKRNHSHEMVEKSHEQEEIARIQQELLTAHQRAELAEQKEAIWRQA